MGRRLPSAGLGDEGMARPPQPRTEVSLPGEAGPVRRAPGVGGLVLLVVLALGAAALFGGISMSGASDDTSTSSRSYVPGLLRETTYPAPEEDVTVTVTGVPHIAFSGSIGGALGQRSVEGVVPETFTIPAESRLGIYTAVIQKQVTGGTLTVSISCARGARTASTSAEYGIVSVTCGP